MKKRGVTLIELITVLAIMSIVFGIIYSILSNSNKLYSKGTIETTLQDSSRWALNRMSEGIRNASTVKKLNTAQTTSITESGCTFIFNSQGSPLLFIDPSDSSQSEYIYAIIQDSKGIKQLNKVIKSTGGSTPSKIELVASNIDKIVLDDSLGQSTIIINLDVVYKNTIKQYRTTASINR